MILKVFIGFDSRQSQVSEVCAYSLKERSSLPLDIDFLDLQVLRDAGLYRRPHDPMAATEFTYSRFLVPFLTSFQGLALYCDNDFLWQDNVANLLSETVHGKAIHCVQHDYRPAEATKMNGKLQTVYPRKNWSSLMLFDCAHPDNRVLTPDTVNVAPPAFLHRMQWLDDDQIGSLDKRWNWLEGWDNPEPAVPLGAIHFTRGGPWLDDERRYAFSGLWLAEMARMMADPEGRPGRPDRRQAREASPKPPLG